MLYFALLKKTKQIVPTKIRTLKRVGAATLLQGECEGTDRSIEN